MIAVCAIEAQPDFRFLGCKPPPPPGIWPVFSASMNKSDASAALQPVTKELVVQNKMGIHARPAAMIVRVTNKFKSEVFVEKDEEQVNGKSIMGLMMLAAGKGSKVKFIATGEDASGMLAEIDALFARKFDEA
ncbi:MAG: HPr family phosphocarrier protein [Opitutaceae bacterium]|nr:HPr family phosphocarrier protein [Opitutaceae bacterium]